ncbi:hypothetical protein T440DRAFT_215033 [Plenodomus tracheiphilus IPT5]|uniref:Uncharacterized protein n=1 Tax=Plenodomus tracheiphilus IPT5 TaxID=1408161 RepID=A0A6A7AW28_9PLEO|nr:hypothetical protein T440DRAFT_215033 [Plenodomus tracheiphilus IPT5]
MKEQHTTPPFLPHPSAAESETHVSIDLEAIVGPHDAWQFADVDWERSLQGRLEDVVHYGLAILPYEELCSLAIEKACPRAWPMRELQRYLSVSLRRDLYSRYADGVSLKSLNLYLGYADGFSIRFCLALENCCTVLRQQIRRNEDDRREEVLWVYAPRQMELPCIRRLPRSITDPIKAILEMLREYPSPRRRDTFEEDTRLWVANRVHLRQPEQTREGVANAGQTLSLGALTEAWRREGYHEHLLRRYVWYRMIKQAPSRQDEVDLFVSQLFDKPWETRHWIPTTDKNDESDLRIHRAR